MADNVDASPKKTLVGHQVKTQPFSLNNKRDVRSQGSIVGSFTILNDDP